MDTRDIRDEPAGDARRSHLTEEVREVRDAGSSTRHPDVAKLPTRP